MVVGGAAARNVATATADSACTASTSIDVLAAATAATADVIGLTTAVAVLASSARVLRTCTADVAADVNRVLDGAIRATMHTAPTTGTPRRRRSR
jgi:hypothetical protein